MASAFNCCMDRKKESLNHILCTSSVANMMWKKVTMIMSVYNVESNPWKLKVHRWVCGARKINLKGVLMCLILVIITWRLWIAQHKAM